MAQFFKSALKNRTLMKFFSQKLTERSLTIVGTLGPYRLYITVHKEAFRRISNAITYVTSLEKLPFCTVMYNLHEPRVPTYDILTNLLNEDALLRDSFGVCNTFSSNSSVSGISSVFSFNDLKTALLSF